jgi:threonine/homoserine/homoserine lactone efflux protein
MDWSLLAKAFGLGFIIAVGVGPITLLVVRRTLSEGRVVGLVSGFGVATADATYGGIAAFGLSAISDVLVEGRRVFALVGGLVLLWLAWNALRSHPTTAASATPRRAGLPGAYLSILGLTLTNPMTILSFGALFTSANVTGSNTAESALITLGVFAASSTWWIILTTILGRLRSRVTPAWLRVANVVSGILIGVLAIASIATAIRG